MFSGFARKVKIPPTAVGGSLIPTYERQTTKILQSHQRELVDGSLPAQHQAAFEESTNSRWWDLKAGTMTAR
jgi:hypothetical protein